MWGCTFKTIHEVLNKCNNCKIQETCIKQRMYHFLVVPRDSYIICVKFTLHYVRFSFLIFFIHVVSLFVYVQKDIICFWPVRNINFVKNQFCEKSILWTMFNELKNLFNRGRIQKMWQHVAHHLDNKVFNLVCMGHFLSFQKS